MNTPTHVIVSLAALPKQSGWAGASALIGGAVLPDAPMFLFYAYQKLRGTPERAIWSDHYFRDEWQLVFDVFNSFPLFLLLMGVSWWFGWQWGMLLSASAMLHLLGDLPLHYDDAHRHFLPFTNWRFHSPVSYWDPRHYGRQFATFEALSAIAMAVWLVWPGNTLPNRTTAALLLPLFVVQAVAVVWFSLTYCEAVQDQLPSAPSVPSVESVAEEAASGGTASDGATSESSTP